LLEKREFTFSDKPLEKKQKNRLKTGCQSFIMKLLLFRESPQKSIALHRKDGSRRAVYRCSQELLAGQTPSADFPFTQFHRFRQPLF